MFGLMACARPARTKPTPASASELTALDWTNRRREIPRCVIGRSLVGLGRSYDSIFAERRRRSVCEVGMSSPGTWLLSLRCTKFRRDRRGRDLVAVPAGPLMAQSVDTLRCEGSDAIGANRTCRERRERVDLTKMT